MPENTLNLGTRVENQVDPNTGATTSLVTLDVPEEFQMPDELIETIEQGYQRMSGVFDAALQEINAIDVDAVSPEEIRGIMDSSFQQAQAGIINGAMAEARKVNLELDAYMGSGSSDARTAARMRMSGEVTRSLMSGAYEAVSKVLMGHSTDLVTAMIKGTVASTSKASALANLIAGGASMFKGMADAYTQTYTSRMSALMNYAQLSIDLHKAELDAALSRESMEIERDLEQQRIDIATGELSLKEYQLDIAAFSAMFKPVYGNTWGSGTPIGKRYSRMASKID